ncbi:guanine nucleotide binding protein, alpha subunit [Pilobolus umbonatus]|nr:guanine nucleotide binding protein, alpha subunit [Pilobolus umbonatus]
MGSGISTKSKAINKQIKMDQRRMEREFKILLLGGGDSGKSTIIKQMRLIYMSPFTREERENYRNMILNNILTAMQTLIEGMNQLELTFDNPDLDKYRSLFFESIPTILSFDDPSPIGHLEPLKSFWNDKNIQEAFSQGHTFAFNENIQYFFDQLDRIFEPSYIPTDIDIIHCRIKTTGIVETKFRKGNMVYRMVDVGGQRSERKKWIHCFDNVTAVLFVVALNGYDCCLVEDKYSMYEAFMLFESICNSKWFIHTTMILLLNKIDLFKKKLSRSKISDYFPDYTGPPTDVEQAKEFFRNRFIRLNHNEKNIYVHFTVATDTHLLAKVMRSVSDSILHENLQPLLL